MNVPVMAKVSSPLWLADWSAFSPDVLRSYARAVAFQIADRVPVAEIARRYLETGDESIRAAAFDLATDEIYGSAGPLGETDQAKRFRRAVLSCAASAAHPNLTIAAQMVSREYVCALEAEIGWDEAMARLSDLLEVAATR